MNARNPVTNPPTRPVPRPLPPEFPGAARYGDEELEAVEAVRGHGLEALCRALLNSNEFLFIP